MTKFALKYKWGLLLILALIILEPTLSSWLYMWLQRMYTTIGPGTQKLLIIRMLAIGVMGWFAKRLLGFTTSVVKSRVICNIKEDVKHSIFTNVMRLDTANISQKAASGEYISIFTNDMALIEQRFFLNIVDLISSIFALLILGASFISLNRTLGTIVILFGATVTFIPAFFAKKLGRKSLEYSNEISHFTQKIKEYLHAYPTIKNYSIESAIEKRFSDANRRVEDSKFEADYSLSLANSVGSMLSWFMQILVIGAGLIMVANGEILLGTMVASLSFAEDLASPLQNIVSNVNSIRSVKEITEKIKSLSESPTPEDEDSSSRPFDNVQKLDLSFRSLTIKAKDKTILDGFSYTFESGKKYLIVGRNGAGKSSIFKALKKRFDDYSGEIFLNDTNIQNLTNIEISSVVSYLNENVAIFSGTVIDNISLFRPCNEADYDRVAKEAQIEFSRDRLIGEDGVNISSGEQRRIEIARSLLSSSKIMIFDEVVSTLDIETAYEIEKMVLDYNKQTMIFISHNFSGKLIKEYDEILVMDKGKLVAHGPYSELIKTSPYFCRICDIKFGNLE